MARAITALHKLLAAVAVMSMLTAGAPTLGGDERKKKQKPADGEEAKFLQLMWPEPPQTPRIKALANEVFQVDTQTGSLVWPEMAASQLWRARKHLVERITEVDDFLDTEIVASKVKV